MASIAWLTLLLKAQVQLCDQRAKPQAKWSLWLTAIDSVRSERSRAEGLEAACGAYYMASLRDPCPWGQKTGQIR